jgi:hypothetical protein
MFQHPRESTLPKVVRLRCLPLLTGCSLNHVSLSGVQEAIMAKIALFATSNNTKQLNKHPSIQRAISLHRLHAQHVKLLGLFFTSFRPWTRFRLYPLRRGLQLLSFAPQLRQLSPDLETSEHPLPQSSTRSQKSNISTGVRTQTPILQ